MKRIAIELPINMKPLTNKCETNCQLSNKYETNCQLPINMKRIANFPINMKRIANFPINMKRIANFGFTEYYGQIGAGPQVLTQTP